MKKLTLNADPETIDLAKTLAAERGTSVSVMFSNWVKFVARRRNSPAPRRVTPITRKLSGIMKPPQGQSDRELIEETLLERYGR